MALARARAVSDRRDCRRGDDGVARRDAARHRLLGWDDRRRQVRSDGLRGPGSRRRVRHRRRSGRAAVRRARRSRVADPPPAGADGRGGRQPRAGIAADRRVAAAGRAAELRGDQPRDRRPGDRGGPAAPGHLRHAGVARRHHPVHRDPVSPDVRRRRHCRDVPRHLRHARLPDVLRVRAVAQRGGGDPDDHRLFGERHDRRLRPRAGEPAVDAARRPGAGGQHQRQPDAVAHGDHGGHDVSGGDVAVSLRRRRAPRVRLHDARRHRERHLFDGVHRLGDCDSAEPAPAGGRGAGGGGAARRAGRPQGARREGLESRR